MQCPLPVASAEPRFPEGSTLHYRLESTPCRRRPFSVQSGTNPNHADSRERRKRTQASSSLVLHCARRYPPFLPTCSLIQQDSHLILANIPQFTDGALVVYRIEC